MTSGKKGIALIVLLFALQPCKAEEKDSLQIIKRNKAISIASVSTTYITTSTLLYFAWYKDYNTGKFHSFDDSKEWLQMDKAGHLATSYNVGRLGYYLGTKSGFNRKQSCFGGGALGLAFLTSVEVLDGFSEGWGFSYSDMLTNIGGYLLFSSQQYFLNQQVFKIKFSYSPSSYRKYRPELLGSNNLEGLLKDYNGQTYWLNINLRGLTKISQIPAFIDLSLGYGGSGMLGGNNNPMADNKGNPLPYFKRKRQGYLSFDIDLNEIKVKNKFLKTVLGGISFIKIPFPTIEFGEKGYAKFHPVFF